MLIQEIINAIEEIAPISYQESYDNCGVQVGDIYKEASGALLTLDVTEAVIEEAIKNNCNLIIAHHPLIFSGLKKITGKNYVERVIIKAIQNNITIYAAHTNLDNMRNGVNQKIAEKLGLINTSILAPSSSNLYKLYTYAPVANAADVLSALWAAGAGQIGNYSECSYSTSGEGTFKANTAANPVLGVAGGARHHEAESKIEVLVPAHLKSSILNALFQAHPYEEVAYEIVALHNDNQEIGAGLIGYLPNPMSENDFMKVIQQNMKVPCIRHTQLIGKPVTKVAVCGGSGSFLFKNAIAAKADIFVTADFKYHQFFDAENKIVIADIGHYESEQFTPEIFAHVLKKNFPNFAVLLSNVLTNPVKYFC